MRARKRTIDDIDFEEYSVGELRLAAEQISRALLQKGGNREPPSHLRYPEAFGPRRQKAEMQTLVGGDDGVESVKMDHCFLGCSLGSAQSEGAHLEASLQWIAQHFAHCRVIVADSLYRFTLQLVEGLGEGASREVALARGADFIERNDGLVRSYSAPRRCRFTMKALSEYEKHPGFSSFQAQILQVYAANEGFRDAIESFANKYVSRIEISSELSADVDPLERAGEYLLEELALFSCIVTEGYRVLVYPGSIESMQRIAAGEFPDLPKPLSRMAFASLRFKRAGRYASWIEEKLVEAPASNLFEELTGAELSTLLDLSELEYHRMGRTLLRQGDPSDAVYVILDGQAVAIARSTTRPHSLKAVFGRGAVAGAVEFMDGRSRLEDVVARTDVAVLKLSRDAFDRLMKDVPWVGASLLQHIGRVVGLRVRDQHTE